MRGTKLQRVKQAEELAVVSVVSTNGNGAGARKKVSEPVVSQRAEAENGLTQAFVSFTRAAGSLERWYTQLQSEVGRLRRELEQKNAELQRSLAENTRMRGFLAEVLENLPCGVVVAGGMANGAVQILNPEARKLLEIAPGWDVAAPTTRPVLLERLLQQTTESPSEEEWSREDKFGARSVAVTRARRRGERRESGERIWILRDVTKEKRLAEEREAARKALALAEIATLLAHEIRNPLGSMELFTGLLAEAAARSPETRQWINHLQAGLRSLSATITNVVDVYINYLRRKIDAGTERPLIRTVRGIGYQIGQNNQLS
jgi:two-component system, sensor histidine kinase FlrB